MWKDVLLDETTKQTIQVERECTSQDRRPHCFYERDSRQREKNKKKEIETKQT